MVCVVTLPGNEIACVMSVNKVIWNKGAQAALGGVYKYTQTYTEARLNSGGIKKKKPFLELHVLLAPAQSKCSVFECA